MRIALVSLEQPAGTYRLSGSTRVLGPGSEPPREAYDVAFVPETLEADAWVIDVVAARVIRCGGRIFYYRG